MKIGLDYDGTYTLDPDFWDNFIYEVDFSEHEVYIVTNRLGDDLDDEVYDVPLEADHIIFTGGKAKHEFVRDNYKIRIDVWIDNEPEFVKENKID